MPKRIAPPLNDAGSGRAEPSVALMGVMGVDDGTDEAKGEAGSDTLVALVVGRVALGREADVGVAEPEGVADAAVEVVSESLGSGGGAVTRSVGGGTGSGMLDSPSGKATGNQAHSTNE